MKKNFFLLTLLFSLLTSVTMKADDEYNPFSELSKMKDVETVIVSPTMLKLAATMTHDADSEILKDVKSVAVYNINSSKASKAANKLVTDFAKNNNLETAVAADDGDEKTYMWIKSSDDEKIEKFLLYTVDGKETTVVYITGKIAMDKIGRLVNTGVPLMQDGAEEVIEEVQID